MKEKNNEGAVIKAGGIILLEKNCKKYILLLYRGKQKDWSFPKGHAEEGESVSETMTREMKEETGLDVDIIKELPEMKYISSTANESVLLHMFLLKPRSEDIKKEFQEDEVEWVPIKDVEERLSYENLKEYFRMIKNYL
jgi:8-oxo-dGTP pyrophosphatase MutT (NUDIX family)